MIPRNLQAVLRSIAAEPAVSDAELLRRVATGNSAAFAELVRRHGRLVWAVCRHLAGSDPEADDAFQATFLVLLRNADKVRDAGRLSAWLHGVAYRVCGRARRTAQRRAGREKAVAVPDRNGQAVPDSAWDRALAAVHEEVGRLPETLRVPFVLCCLEGKGVTEAADQLGWKLGTFSGRLTRAKDLLLARLDLRGLTVGVVIGLGLAAPPAATIAATSALIQPGKTVPNSIVQLTRGVMSMKTTTFKLLAAGILIASGLGLGTGGLPTAGAEQPNSTPVGKAATDPAALQSDLTRALDAADVYLLGQLTRAEGATAHTKKWDYDFVEVSNLSQSKFFAFLQDREDRGWEFIGSTPMPVNDRPSAVWVFRRPRKVDAAPAKTQTQTRYIAQTIQVPVQVPRTVPANRAALEAEIARLQKQLASLPRKRVELPKSELPLSPSEMVPLMSKLAEKKFPTQPALFTWDDKGLYVEGDTVAVDWAIGMIKKMAEK